MNRKDSMVVNVTPNTFVWNELLLHIPVELDFEQRVGVFCITQV
jgi:hypothetical protein